MAGTTSYSRPINIIYTSVTVILVVRILTELMLELKQIVL